MFFPIEICDFGLVLLCVVDVAYQPCLLCLLVLGHTHDLHCTPAQVRLPFQRKGVRVSIHGAYRGEGGAAGFSFSLTAAS